MPRTSRKRASALKPHTLVIRTYQMGFGDCFLLTFQYEAADDRHILIDFGTVKRPEGRTKLFEEVAASIREETDEKLHMVVATHRHKDHIGGFGRAKEGKIIEDLKPDLVVQPWTEDPRIKTDAKHPAASNSGARRQLMQMNRFSDSYFGDNASGNIRHLAAADKDLFDKMTFIGEDNITNVAAVKRLMKMGKAGSAVYVHANQELDVSDILPGVEIDVLGPPTLKQQPSVKTISHKNEDQFWIMQAAAASRVANGKSDPFPQHKKARGDWDTKWTRYRLKKIRLEMLYQIVRILDKALNNTSLILLFRAGGKSFLFPGDAQWENWSFALNDEKILKKLAEVDVYKVGHHASPNATPKKLWNVFEKKDTTASHERLISLVSTLSGKYGKKSNNSEVPRGPLIDALDKHSEVVMTERFGDDILFEEVAIPL